MMPDKENEQRPEQDSSLQLEPIDQNIVPENLKVQEGDAVDDFLENYPLLLIRALMFFLQQDSQNLRLTINETQSFFAEAKKVAQDEIDILVMQLMTNLIALFEPMQRGVMFLAEGRFKTAQREFKALKETCYSHAEELKTITGAAGQEKLEVIESHFLIFKLFGGWMAGLEGHCAAELIGYQGRTREYILMLKETVKVLREAVAVLPAGSAPELVQLGSMCSKSADQLEARSEAFESMLTTKNYLEPFGQKVFIIHGHDEARWRELRDLLKNEFNLQVIVLKEEPGGGRTIINKFEDYAMDTCAAFALLTPDDFVNKGETEYLQARPNVLFEMGWFYGRFGTQHLCILKSVDTELPSDLAGISTIEFRENITEQSLAIRKELRQVGLVS